MCMYILSSFDLKQVTFPKFFVSHEPYDYPLEYANGGIWLYLIVIVL